MFYRGLWKDCLNKGNEPDELEAISGIISGTIGLEKMKGFPIYKMPIKTGDKLQGDRLLFIEVGQGDNRVLVRFKRLLKHHYNRLDKKNVKQFLQNFGIDEAILEDDTRFTTKKDKKPQRITQTVRYYNNQLLILNAEQDELLSYRPPIVIKGDAGSGKTLVIYEWILNLLDTMPEDDRREILYVAENGGLVLRVNSYLSERLVNHPKGYLAKAITYADLSCQLDDDCLQATRVGYREFEQWLRAQNNFSWADLINDPKRTYEGLRELSAYMRVNGDFTPEQYLEGSTRGLFCENKAYLLEIYLAYREHMIPVMKQNQQNVAILWDPALYDLQAGSPYYAIFVDEAPDLSPLQWWSLYHLVATTHEGYKRIYFAGDPCHQRLCDRQSLYPLMLSLMHQMNSNVTEITLEGSYRCPDVVVEFNDGFLSRIRNLASAGTFGRGENRISRTKTSHKSGELQGMLPNEQTFALIQEALLSPNCCILTRERSLKRASARFRGLIFTPSQIKGEDYERVILFEMFCKGRDDIELVTLVADGPHIQELAPFNRDNPIVFKQGAYYYLWGRDAKIGWTLKRLDPTAIIAALSLCQVIFPEERKESHYLISNTSLDPLYNFIQTIKGHIHQEDEELLLLETQLASIPNLDVARRDNGRRGEAGDDRVITYINDIITASTRPTYSLWVLFIENRKFKNVNHLLKEALKLSHHEPALTIATTSTKPFDIDGWEKRIQILRDDNLHEQAEVAIRQVNEQKSLAASLSPSGVTNTTQPTKKLKKKVSTIPTPIEPEIAPSSKTSSPTSPVEMEVAAIHKKPNAKIQTYLNSLLKNMNKINLKKLMKFERATDYLSRNVESEANSSCCLLEVILRNDEYKKWFCEELSHHQSLMQNLIYNFYLQDTQTVFHVAARLNAAALITKLCGVLLLDPEMSVNQKNTILDRKTQIDQTALYFSMSRGHREATNALLDGGALPCNIWSRGISTFFTVIDYSSDEFLQQFQMTRDIIVEGCYTPSLPNATPLFIAAQHGNVNQVKALLLTNPNDLECSVGQFEATPLHVAVQHDALEVVELLLNSGARISRAMNNGATALILAAQFGYKSMVQLLLQKGALAEIRVNNDNREYYPLLSAVDQGHHEIVTMLYRNGANIFLRFNNLSLLDISKLTHASFRNNLSSRFVRTQIWIEIIIRRLERYVSLFDGLDEYKLENLFIIPSIWTDFFINLPNHVTNQFELMIFCFFKSTNIALFCNFLKQDMDKNIQQNTLHQSIFYRIMIEIKDYDNIMLLHIAALYNCIAIYELCLLFNKNILRGKDLSMISFDVPDTRGSTPLIFSMMTKNIATLRFLIKEGVSLTTKFTAGKTALRMAIHFEDLLAVHAILETESGLSTINTKDDQGLSPIEYVMNKYCCYKEPILFELANILIKKGASLAGLSILKLFFFTASENGVSADKIMSIVNGIKARNDKVHAIELQSSARNNEIETLVEDSNQMRISPISNAYCRFHPIPKNDQEQSPIEPGENMKLS